jgi:hypothetical protein
MNAPPPFAPPPPKPFPVATFALFALGAALAYRFVTTREEETKAEREVSKLDRELRETTPFQPSPVYWEDER